MMYIKNGSNNTQYQILQYFISNNDNYHYVSSILTIVFLGLKEQKDNELVIAYSQEILTKTELHQYQNLTQISLFFCFPLQIHFNYNYYLNKLFDFHSISPSLISKTSYMISKEAIKFFVITPFVISIITFILAIATFVYLIIENYIGFNKSDYNLTVCSSNYLNKKYSHFQQILSFQFLVSLLSICILCGNLVLQVLVFLAYRNIQNDDQIMIYYTKKKLIMFAVFCLSNLLMVQVIFTNNITFLIQRNSCQSIIYTKFMILSGLAGLNWILNFIVFLILLVLANKFSELEGDSQKDNENKNFKYNNKHEINDNRQGVKQNLLEDRSQNIYDNTNNNTNNNQNGELSVPKKNNQNNKKNNPNNKKNIFDMKNNNGQEMENSMLPMNLQNYKEQVYDWPVKPKRTHHQNMNNLFVQQNHFQKNPNYQSVHRITLTPNVMNVNNKENLSSQKQQKKVDNMNMNMANQPNAIKQNGKNNDFLKVQVIPNSQRKNTEISEQMDYSNISRNNLNPLIPNQQEQLVPSFKMEDIQVNLAPNSSQKTAIQEKKNFQTVDDLGRYYFIQKSKIKIRNCSKINLKPQVQQQKNPILSYKRKQTFIKPRRTPSSSQWRIKQSDEISLQDSIYNVKGQQSEYDSNQLQNSSNQLSQSSQSDSESSYESQVVQNRDVVSQDVSNILNLVSKDKDMDRADQSKINQQEVTQKQSKIKQKQKQKEQKKKNKKKIFDKLFLHLVPKKQIDLKLKLFDVQEYIQVDSYNSVLNGKQLEGIQQVQSHRDKMSVLSKVKADQRYLIRSKDPDTFEFKLMRTIKNKYGGI